MKIKLLTNHTDSSIGLRLAGVDSVIVRNASRARQALEELCSDEELGLLLVTAETESMCRDELTVLRQKGRPLIVCIPDSNDAFKQTNTISDYIKNAIGIKID